MRSFSINQFESPYRDKNPALIICIYLFRPDISHNHLDAELAKSITTGCQYDAVHFVGMKECIDLVVEMLKIETAIRGRLEHVLSDIFRDVCFITFDETSGMHTALQFDKKPVEDASSVLESHRRYSLLALFHEGGGLIQAPKEYHYVKPSKKHAEKFIRASNVLELDGAANIISFWLLPFLWKKNIKNIVVDTSGIAAVGWSLAHLVSFYGGAASLHTVTSHSSYDGLKDLIIKNPGNTFVLISATTSGDLRNELIEKGVSDLNLHTLFYLGEGAEEAGSILCDLTKRDELDSMGIIPFKSYKKGSCPFCSRKSYPISLVGDQFSPEPTKIVEIEINKTDLSLPQHKVIERLAGTGVLSVHKTIGSRIQEFYFNVEAIYKKPPKNAPNYKDRLALHEEVSKRWNGMVARGSPVSLNRLVYADYPYSHELAKSTKRIISKHHSFDDLKMLDSRSLKSAAPTPETAALVVVSCIDDSQNLMGINRDLRSAQPNGNTTYISPIFRGTSRQERERIRSNLTYGENGINTFSLYSIYPIDLPEETENQSWRQEIYLLNEFFVWLDAQDIPRPGEFVDRVTYLTEIPRDGMSNRLFWPNSSCKELSIRPDFTLLDTRGGSRELSQADIYVVVSAVFHSLRQGVKGKPKLEYKTYSRSVISPDNFQRLNDGIIQAAMLRAACDYELAYGSSDFNVSKRMRNLLLSFVNKADEEDGEALMEFLLAMASKRLTLHQNHTHEVMTAVDISSNVPDYYKLFAKYINSQLGLLPVG